VTYEDLEKTGWAGCMRSEQASCIRLVAEKEKEKEKDNENVLFDVGSLIVFINCMSLVTAQNFDFKYTNSFNS
jgi:hypothetical protein